MIFPEALEDNTARSMLQAVLDRQAIMIEEDNRGKVRCGLRPDYLLFLARKDKELLPLRLLKAIEAADQLGLVDRTPLGVWLPWDLARSFSAEERMTPAVAALRRLFDTQLLEAPGIDQSVKFQPHTAAPSTAMPDLSTTSQLTAEGTYPNAHPVANNAGHQGRVDVDAAAREAWYRILLQRAEKREDFIEDWSQGAESGDSWDMITNQLTRVFGQHAVEADSPNGPGQQHPNRQHPIPANGVSHDVTFKGMNEGDFTPSATEVSGHENVIASEAIRVYSPWIQLQDRELWDRGFELGVDTKDGPVEGDNDSVQVAEGGSRSSFKPRRTIPRTTTQTYAEVWDPVQNTSTGRPESSSRQGTSEDFGRSGTNATDTRQTGLFGPRSPRKAAVEESAAPASRSSWATWQRECTISGVVTCGS
jgi:hypothetical protein